MIRLRVLVSCAAIAAVIVASSASVATVGTRQDRFQSGVEVIVVPTAVTSNGRPVTGLTAADFALTDNGVGQLVEAVSVETLPIDVTLVLDASNSVRGAMLDRLKRAVADISALLTPRDQLRLIAVQHIVREVFPWRPGGGKPPLDGLAAGGSTSLFDGVAAAMMRTTPVERRHLVVVFTDGFDTSSAVTSAAAQKIASMTDAVVHAVVVIEDLQAMRTNRVPSADPLARGRVSVKAGLSAADEQQLPEVRPIRDAVVAPTGGQVFPVDASGPITDAFSAAVRAFRTSYVLRYLPTGVAKSSWHTISVSVTRPGHFDVRARKGYE
jgi:hypothetical protein